MNEQSQSVHASAAPDIPPVAAESPAPVATVSVNPAPVAAPDVPAPVGPPTPAPVGVSSAPTPAPDAVQPDYRALYENLRRENEILRQNADTARRSPVQGVSGGGVVTVPNDDFIRGFDSDTW